MGAGGGGVGVGGEWGGLSLKEDNFQVSVLCFHCRFGDQVQVI